MYNIFFVDVCFLLVHHHYQRNNVFCSFFIINKRYVLLFVVYCGTIQFYSNFFIFISIKFNSYVKNCPYLPLKNSILKIKLIQYSYKKNFFDNFNQTRKLSPYFLKTYYTFLFFK